MQTTQTCLSAGDDLRAGKCSAESLTRQCLRQIERFESRVHAWVRWDADRALTEARWLDDELRGGHDRGPLHGIPVGIKDIIDVACWPTEAGSPLYRGRIAQRDAPLVARLREAGAVIVGKTVTTEFAGFDPPPTRNPWNLDRTPGGSSSGSAAAVALGMCLAAIGTQTGGSIVRPASFCGICGFKPAIGQVSLDGVVPISVHLDHPGPMTRTVADLALVYRAIAEPGRPACWPAAWQQPSAAASGEGQRPRTLGRIVGRWIDEAATNMLDVYRQALARFHSRGVALVDFELPPSFADVHRLHRRIMARDYFLGHRESFAAHRNLYGQHVAAMIEDGSRISDAEMAEALAHQTAFREELFARVGNLDALVMPSTFTTAPGPETTGDPRFNSPWSYAGFPSLTLPCGLADDGLPVGLQLIGRPTAVETLLDAAAWCETSLEFAARPALLGEAD